MFYTVEWPCCVTKCIADNFDVLFLTGITVLPQLKVKSLVWLIGCNVVTTGQCNCLSLIGDNAHLTLPING